MFLLNFWYVAGWSKDFEAGKLHGMKIAGVPMVLYRREDASMIAMVDRCPHRWAPLSKGRLEGDTLRCMYHGVRFGSDGRCVEVPEQSATPAALTVQTFPVTERHKWVWVWPGDPEKADPALIPHVGYLDEDADRLYRIEQIDYDAHYLNICDNLLDLSHVSFLHQNTLARGALRTDYKPRITEIEGGVRVSYWKRDSATGAASRGPDGKATDAFNTYDMVLPGIFRLRSRAYPAGTAAACNDGTPPDDMPALMDDVSGQAVVPMTEHTTRYFFSFGTRKEGGENRLAKMWPTVLAAFEEDRGMIEAQQRIIDDFPGQQMAAIAADRGAALFRRLVERTKAQERA